MKIFVLKSSIPYNQTLWFFSYEKNFFHDQMVNIQNNRLLALFSQDERIVVKTKHSVHIMLFGMVNSNSNVMPQFIFPHGLTFNTEVYIKHQDKVMLTWIEREADGRPDVW